MTKGIRRLAIVLGDQLDQDSSIFDDFDRNHDLVWMAEITEEATHVWSHKARIAIFLSTMRHFRDLLTEKRFTVRYRTLDDPSSANSLRGERRKSLVAPKPQSLLVVEPGEWRVREILARVAKEAGLPLEVRADRRFLCSRHRFKEWASGRSQLRMEFFYQMMRRKMKVLVDGSGPAGGRWNYDQENRESFREGGPGSILDPIGFKPDKITRDVLDLVEERFPEHPGNLRHFDWPVTSQQARFTLEDFIETAFPSSAGTKMPCGVRRRSFLIRASLHLSISDCSILGM